MTDLFKRKIRVVVLMLNGDLVFTKKAYDVNKITMDWGDVKFQFKNLFSRTPKLWGFFPVLFLKKHYVVIREGDKEALGFGTIPLITMKDIVEIAKSELLKHLGLDLPKERRAIEVLILLGVMFCALMEILRMAGVHVG